MDILPLRPLKVLMVGLAVKRSRRINEQLQKIDRVAKEARSATQQSEYSRLDRKQQRSPLEEQLMPTRLGNLLKGRGIYSLKDMDSMPLSVGHGCGLFFQSLSRRNYRSHVQIWDAAARVWFWCLTLYDLGVLIWPLAVVGLLSSLFTYYCWAIPSATNYGELIRATFDIPS